MGKTWLDAEGINVLTDRTHDTHAAALRLIEKDAVLGQHPLPLHQRLCHVAAAGHFWAALTVHVHVQIHSPSVKCTSTGRRWEGAQTGWL